MKSDEHIQTFGKPCVKPLLYFCECEMILKLKPFKKTLKKLKYNCK